MGIKSCKDCEDRYPGCHSTCKTYKREKYEDQQAKKYLKSFDDDCYTTSHERHYRRKVKRGDSW